MKSKAPISPVVIPKNINPEVTEFLDEQNHPFYKEIEHLRNYILLADEDLVESIKWNGPNYSYKNQDRITMRMQPTTLRQVQLIFHRGAKKQEEPLQRIISHKSKLLKWLENDRAVITYKSLKEIEQSKSELAEIIQEWIKAK
jgi:hypothetical protein